MASASWDDHQRQNPFQTAREFSATEHHHHEEPAPRRPRDRGPAAASRTVSNPYESITPTPPTIPESLKRKYRPPVKQSGNNNNTSSAASTQQKQTKQQTQKKNDNNDDDEDDLPEELKRFGKELVQKIENEIMHGGEPTTFDDIAGLQDAKQTIQEVICWPMKRPDLFTGLRRAPNGLLLYGPPGTGKVSKMDLAQQWLRLFVSSY